MIIAADLTPLEQAREQIRLRKATLAKRRRVSETPEARNRYRLREEELGWMDALLASLTPEPTVLSIDDFADKVTELEVEITSDNRHFVNERNGARLLGASIRKWLRNREEATA